MPDDTLPPEVTDALARGETIEAIRLLRSLTGLDLKESKDMIDAFRAGRVVELPAARAAGAALEGLPAEAITALRRGRKIEAIKLTRLAGRLSLKEAKDRVEAYEHGAGPPTTTMAAGASPGLAPGEVPRSGAGRWIVVAVVVIAVLGYFLVR